MTTVLTGPKSPVSIPNPVTGVLTGRLCGIPHPDTTLGVLNTTLIPMLLSSYLFLQQKYSPDTELSFKDEYDYIVVGGGTAGSIIANRLSEEGCRTVLLLEAGKTPPALTEVPAASVLLRSTEANWCFLSEPQEDTAEELYEKRIAYDAGRGLGGSSLINGMLYSRGNKQDYNDWATMGAKGWNYENCRPYFLKLENNTDMDLASNDRCHNVSGPMTFSRPRYTSYLNGPVLKGAKSLGYDVVDANCEEQQLGMADLQTFIRHGQRCSAAKAYLVPVDDRPNLDIVTEAFVTKIHIVDKSAQGVYFDYKGSSHCVRAKQEVILSAGAINSPKILILSGVGPEKTLQEHKIPKHADLPVGANLQDHVTAVLFFSVPLPRLAYPPKLISPISIEKYYTNRSGALASPAGVFGLAYLRTNNATTQEGVPNIQCRFSEGDNDLIRFTYGVKPLTYEKLFLPYEASATMWCSSSVLNPKSRGFVTIKSTDPYENPIIDPKFLSDSQDVTDIVAGLKFCLQIANTDELKKLGVEPFKTKMPDCESLANDMDKYLECYVKKFTYSPGDQSCTVKMGNDTTAVVDPEFRVIGINKLRVIDSSTMPKIVSGNIMIPTMMMAERGSDIIKESIHCP